MSCLINKTDILSNKTLLLDNITTQYYIIVSLSSIELQLYYLLMVLIY